MQEKKTRRVIIFGLLAICLYIYLAYRPSNTVVQIIFRSVFPIDSLVYIQNKSFSLPSWTVNSLPEGFWVFCMTWISSDFRFKKFCLWWSPLLFALGLEILQYFGITDGTFDWVDVLFSIVFSLLAIRFLPQRAKTTYSSISYYAVLLFIGYLLVVFSDVIY